MKVHIIEPFSISKNLGAEYNAAMRLIPDEDWVCLKDCDTMFLTPTAPRLLYEYVDHFPEAGLLTCYTNRVHRKATLQLLNGKVSYDTNIDNHIEIAKTLEQEIISATRIKVAISGFLMMISKKTWNEIKFDETGKCLGVDNAYSQKILEARKDILRMNSLYLFHSYRIGKEITDTSHLQ